MDLPKEIKKDQIWHIVSPINEYFAKVLGEADSESTTLEVIQSIRNGGGRHKGTIIKIYNKILFEGDNNVTWKFVGDYQEINSNDKKECYLNGKLHSFDCPAIEIKIGKFWYQNGESHRADGPAIEWATGFKEYYLEGEKITDQPEIDKIETKVSTDIYGVTRYSLNDVFHRLDGPAWEKDGNKEWYKYGKLHRQDGPAKEWADGRKEYYLEGKQITDQIEIDRINTIRTVFDNRVEYKLGEKFHRLDGPAIEFTSGSKYWCQYGKYHRLDGPAIEFTSGSKYWYQNGKYHRLNGPAIEYNDGKKEYWIAGKPIIDQTKIDAKNNLSPNNLSPHQMSFILTTEKLTKSWFSFEPEKSQSVDALYRITANQISKAIQATVNNRIRGFDRLPMGNQLLNYAIGYGLDHSNNQMLKSLGSEFRIEAIAGAGEKMLNALIAEVIDAIEEQEIENDVEVLNATVI